MTSFILTLFFVPEYKYFEDKILHIANPRSRDSLTSDSPAESLQEGIKITLALS